MLRYFRRVRKRLLTENRVNRYFLYAAGEILLVVLGILIALQINTWNNKRLEREAAIDFYKNIRQQLISDLGNIEGQMAYNARHREPFEFAVQVIEADNRNQRDSVSALAALLADYSDFDRQGNIYESMVSSGDIKLVHNDGIKDGLRDLEETYHYVNRMESIHFDFIMGLMPQLVETVRLTDGKVSDEDRLYGTVFQNFFALSLRITGEKEAVYERAIREIDALLALIETEVQADHK